MSRRDQLRADARLRRAMFRAAFDRITAAAADSARPEDVIVLLRPTDLERRRCRVEAVWMADPVEGVEALTGATLAEHHRRHLDPAPGVLRVVVFGEHAFEVVRCEIRRAA